jgi:hypothetical protein
MEEIDIGWLRRSRTTDAGAVILFGAAACLATRGTTGLWALAALVALLGFALTLAYHDRRLERRGGQLELVEAWWLLGSWRRRRLTVTATQVRIGAQTSRGGGVVLAIEGDRPVVLERWGLRSQRIFALSLAKRLARWLGVPLSGADEGQGDLGDPASRMAALRAALPRTDGGDDNSAQPPNPHDPLAGRFLGRRWWLETFRDHCLVIVGGALLIVFILQPPGLWLDAVALVAGSLVLVEGLRGIFPGKIVSRLDPHGLVIERRGLSGEVRLFIPYSDVSTLALRDAQTSGALLLGFEDYVVEVGPRTVGLGPGEWRRFRATFINGLARWLDQRLRLLAAVEPSASMAAPPDISYPEARFRPRSVLALFGSTFPRLGGLIALGFLGANLLFARSLASHFGRIPAHVSFAIPSIAPDLLLKLLAFLTCAVGAAALLYASTRIAWSAPEFRGQIVVYWLILPLSLYPVMEAGLVGVRLVDAGDMCGGAVVAPRFPVVHTETTIQYGPFQSEWIPSRRTRSPGGEFLVTRDASDHLEVWGALGGHHLVVARGFHEACDTWRSAVLP